MTISRSIIVDQDGNRTFFDSRVRCIAELIRIHSDSLLKTIDSPNDIVLKLFVANAILVCIFKALHQHAESQKFSQIFDDDYMPKSVDMSIPRLTVTTLMKPDRSGFNDQSSTVSLSPLT
jgi:hypothetical protein